MTREAADRLGWTPEEQRERQVEYGRQLLMANKAEAAAALCVQEETGKGKTGIRKFRLN